MEAMSKNPMPSKPSELGVRHSAYAGQEIVVQNDLYGVQSYSNPRKISCQKVG